MGGDCPVSGTLVEDLALSGTVDGLREAGRSIAFTNGTLLPGAHLRISSRSAEELVAYNEYDGLGQLKQKKVGGVPGIDYETAQGLQTVAYGYNVRGWLTDINDVTVANPNKLFNFRIGYNTGANPLYNGNISGTQWRTANDDSSLKGYAYSYDALNRILTATDNTGNYNVSGITYDRNGNIQGINRNGWQDSATYTNMDVLDFDYGSGNQLLRVSDTGNGAHGFKDGTNTGNDYGYDQNGNLLSDANKGVIQVLYNHLNMPTKITVTGANAGVLDYVYSADGTKLQKKKTQSGSTITTDYIGDYVYENNVLKQITQPEGYIEPDGSGWQYVYRLTDIWGNTRITFADDNNDGSVNSSEIRREQNYYPGGLEHRGYNSNSYGVQNNLKTYQKQEFTEDLGLNTHEWRYRVSDPATLRFWQIDPLAEDYMYNSTYAFAENKLGMGIELEGAEIWTWAQQKLVTNAVVNPNGASAKVLNFLDQTAQVVEAGASALGGIAHDLAPIRPADENDPQTIGEWWDGVKGAPEAISSLPGQLGEVYENGTIAEKTTATIGVLGAIVSLKKGKTNSLKNPGRSGKQQRLKELANDDKLGKTDRGWIKNEMRHIDNGNRKTIRNPGNSRNSKGRGKELAHPRGKRAKDGHSYKDAKLQDADLHKLEHKHSGY